MNKLIFVRVFFFSCERFIGSYRESLIVIIFENIYWL